MDTTAARIVFYTLNADPHKTPVSRGLLSSPAVMAVIIAVIVAAVVNIARHTAHQQTLFRHEYNSSLSTRRVHLASQSLQHLPDSHLSFSNCKKGVKALTFSNFSFHNMMTCSLPTSTALTSLYLSSIFQKWQPFLQHFLATERKKC